MTTTENRTTTRETTACARSHGKVRPIVVSLAGGTITLRLKGERKAYRLPVATAYVVAVQAHAAAEKHRRKQERDAKRKARAAD